MNIEVYRNIIYRSNTLHLLAIKVAVEQKRSFFDRGTNEYVNWSTYNPLQDAIAGEVRNA